MGQRKKKKTIVNTLLRTDLLSTTAHISYIYSVGLKKIQLCADPGLSVVQISNIFIKTD